MKLHIVVPTIMTNPVQEFECISKLSECFNSHKLDYTIYFVANTSLPEFDNYISPNSNIIKSVSGVNFSISHAINSIFKHIEFNDNDILGFIQSDTFFKNNNWILDYISILNDKKLNAGVIGARMHTLAKFKSNKTPALINNNFELLNVAWSDGVMLFTGKIFRQTTGFDESYFGDRESQDFCYTVYHLGYSNYILCDTNDYFGYENRAANFENKARFDKNDFLQKVNNSKCYFYSKWEHFIKELI